MKRLFISLLILVASALPAGAQGGGAGYVPEGSYVWAGVYAPPRIVPAVDYTVTRRPQIWCALFEFEAGGGGGGIGVSHRRVAAPQDQGAYALQCFEAVPPPSPLYYGPVLVLWPTDGSQFPGSTEPGRIRFAIDSLVFPSAPLTSAPPADRLVVGFETWFATVGTDVQRVIADAEGYYAIAEARPVAVEVGFGDGDEVRCALPLVFEPGGRPTCARHTYYDHRLAPGGRFTVTASYVYDVYVATNENPAFRYVETVVSPPTPLVVTVRELQAVLR